MKTIMVKNILGLDLGTNSIGWALIKQDFENKQGEILGMGSRIIPMSQDILGDFGKGNSVSQTAERTKYRSVRRLRERFLLRRERLHRVLNVLDFLPEHYASQIDFNKRFGKFKEETEPKLAYSNDGFIFKKSFEEMIPDFKTHQPQLLENNKKVPYDWTIYYLRNKALSHKIEKEELAWILLNFNQKRGYYQLRGEDFEEEKDKVFVRLKVDRVVDSGENVKGRILYDVYFENGWKYEKQIVKTEDWIGRTKEFIVTESILKNGDTKRTFKTVDSEKDWIAIKTKTEQEIDKSHKTVGAYIYETLLQNPKQKIKGKLVRTIERKFYKAELKKILEKQKEFHPELRQDDLYNDCVRELYKNNEAHQLTLSKKDFVHLFMEDIIFYQRPLRSQKSSISNCTLEFRKYKDENGTEHIQYLKALPKSNPYYQEFRIWQWMYNLNIYKKEDDTNVTKHFLNTKADFESLFEFLNNRKEVDQKALLKHFKLNDKTHRWKYVEDKKYPCNETKTMISERLKKVENISDDFLTREIEQKIWHIIYSVNDKVEYEKALKSFAGKNNLEKNSFFEAFKKFPPFKSEYGAFSEKAIKKLLPLMRLGKHWDYSNISEQSKSRIQKIITGEYDENIKDRVREKAVHLTKETDFQGLQLWLAQYIVYGRHSEAAMLGKWNSADDLEEFLKEFKQHSLRNPIVEQVITETLRVIKDIWVKYGNGAKDFFNEIHIELGREMKLPAEDRKKITSQISENENTNLRIKALLAEMMADSSVENVRPFSPMQQEILKIYEDGVLNSDIEIEDDILKISKTAQPSPSDLKRYKLWLEQKYKSPYTGQIIPLNKLFTPEYEIEHIIPQSRYFDDSFSNKVICESAVNKLKDNFIGLGFIKQFGGTIVECGNGKSVTVLKEDQYEDFVKKHYANNRSKRNKLLLEDIPEKMIERQMNDTRYISKYISGVLSNIVRTEDGTDDGVNSKNIVPGSGKITNTLKQDWGLNDIWNDLILPRFERMNQLTNSTDFTVWNENHQKFLPTVPVEFSKGFSKKRIDHRHHALDALVIACATKDHVNLLNNQSAKSDTKRYDLKKKLMKFEKVVYKNPHTGEKIEREVPKQFLKPWETFTVDAKSRLETIIVSFKQNLRVINKATNYYEKYVEKEGKKVKERVEQTGTNWAIRKPLHEETVSGKINLPWVETSKGEFITATRKPLDISFNLEKIKKITDTAIQKILENYLETKDNNPELAFSPEGIEDLNKSIEKYNGGKLHQPIIKVRVYEKGKGRFSLGQTGNKVDKYVQGSPNLFFAVYKDENGKNSFESIRLDIVIERMKQMLNPVPDLNSNGEELFKVLSPLDLVYIPTEEELHNIETLDFNKIDKIKLERLYNVNDFSGVTIYFSQNSFAKNIYPKEMDMSWNEKRQKTSGSFDSKTASFNKKSIKEFFVKLKIDRLGNISKV
ncbi:type II CRISPR RNA-guided endonuclease Cas9 [Elizabethkingia anophelis]|nr:type II CRISPR RNA-guided endonuclease Cas9 [Elizabethkingia anophelis]MCT3632140.1 type II CRISPR RNA-guided endonuclease Cas9 [Elizabethkingia anophelis]MCT3829165.1 type II CRISPR RNA-guided endonuclease Cas9 [Elizabethkingia anophelis]MCT3882641.1 type II CRISPR RNA-guided endonuclease Cas9 [Elizabethkingia anophelis]MCT3893114.1 type II CRISPR RNA-guided endonuclease Cas9 [Elizabethkingia anophelis]